MKRIDNPADWEICEFDGVSSTGVYIGPLDALYRVNNRLKWRVDPECSVMCYDPYRVLTLKEIQEQIPHRLITVIDNGPMHGEIYQCGNYGDDWYCIGETDGYA